MKKWLYAGSLLLLIQLGLAAVFHANENKLAPFSPNANLLDFSPAAVDMLTIYGDNDAEVTLNKVNGDWLLPEKEFKAPADKSKIEGLLKKLASLKQGLAVATTADAIKHFKVGEDDFVRHVVLKNGENTVGNLYLGTTPGFKMVYARVQDQPEIASIPLNTYELETDYDSWLDHAMVQVAEDAITHLTIGDIELTRQDNAWSMAGMQDNEELNTTGVDNLVAKISGLAVDGILDPDKYGGLLKEHSVLTITLTLKDGTKRTYVLAKPDKEKYSVMQATGYDYLFKVSNWRIDELTKFTRDKLVKTADDASQSVPQEKHPEPSQQGDQNK